MRNRDQLINQIENIEGYLKTLRGIVARQEPLETYNLFLTKAEDTLTDVKAMIEREDMSPNEMNKTR